MSAGHTPGPWRASDDGRVFWAEPTGPNTARHTTLARECSNANARLIAAAPELLAALEALALSYGAMFPPNKTTPVLQKAIAAIVKATGQ